jgi:tellurite methyltransferase
MPSLFPLLGNTDIYLIDQILRGRLHPGMRILDAGCGTGRNIHYLINEGYDVTAIDIHPQSVPNLLPEKFHLSPIENFSHPDASFDFIICNTVLHFATDDAHFEAMLKNLFRLLKPGGIFFARLATTIGIEHQIEPLGGRRYRTLDGGERYLADAALLHHIEEKQGLTPLDPLKTTIVENQRAMTTWVVSKQVS